MNHPLLILMVCACFLGCMSSAQENSPVYSLIPFPVSLESKEGFSDITSIYYSPSNELTPFISWLESWDHCAIATGRAANLFLKSDGSLHNTQYILSVTADQININYGSQMALRNGLSTLYQLQSLNNGKVPLLTIHDQNKFSYRGMHLDVARHMFSTDSIKEYIDYLAFYKLNKFHWHLTEDQGWRIEIKKYPKLQTVAAFRKETLIGHYNDRPQKFDGQRYGGYYTQEEVRDIVSYAASRGIEVIPEIDIPGHSLALLSAYPELGCEDKKYEAATKWGVFTDVLCPKEETFRFLQNVFDEVIELFPSKYIHIGGDECPKDTWKKSPLCQSLIKEHNLKDEHGLQSYFIKRIESYLNSKGRNIIGWDEILEGGLAPNATVMSWRGVQGGIDAASANHNVIMTPTSHCYFDYYQSDREDEPLAIGGYLPVKKVYSWNPIPNDLPEKKHKYILGGQGNVWTEYIPTFRHVQYMSLARMATLSEVLWGKNGKDYDHFSTLLLSHIEYWKNQNVNIANHLFEPTITGRIIDQEGVGLNAENLPNGTTNWIKTPIDSSFMKFINPYLLTEQGTYEVKTTYEAFESMSQKVLFTPHLGNRAKIELSHQPAEKYSGSGIDCVINGIEGSNHKYGGPEWLGFSGNDFDATITFNEVETISSVSVKCFDGEGQWIYLPKQIFVYNLLEDGSSVLLAKKQVRSSGKKTLKTSLSFDPISASKLQITVENFGKIPSGRQGAGHDSWLFVDEIIIN